MTILIYQGVDHRTKVVISTLISAPLKIIRIKCIEHDVKLHNYPLNTHSPFHLRPDVCSGNTTHSNGHLTLVWTSISMLKPRSKSTDYFSAFSPFRTSVLAFLLLIFYNFHFSVTNGEWTGILNEFQ